MKAKLETSLLVMVMTINACLLQTNTVVESEIRYNQTKSTANHIEIKEDIKNKLVSSKVSKEEVKEKIEDPIVYDGLTLNEISNKLDRALNSSISGYGRLIASHSLKVGVDPYMALAIILQETGCKWDCSYLVKSCNNVGGQVGSGCGGYNYYNSLDEGIISFIDNLYDNYISYNLTTPELINPKYAADISWSSNVNKYIEIIKAQ